MSDMYQQSRSIRLAERFVSLFVMLRSRVTVILAAFAVVAGVVAGIPVGASAQSGVDDPFSSGPAITGPEYCLNFSFGGPVTYPFDSDGDGVADVCSLPRTRRAAAARQNALERLGLEGAGRLGALFAEECLGVPETFGEPDAEADDDCATGELRANPQARSGGDGLFFSGPVITGPEFCLNLSFGGPVTYPFDSDGDGVADVCSLPRTRRAAAARQNALERLGHERVGRFQELFAEECLGVPETFGEPDAEADDECEEHRSPPPPPPPPPPPQPPVTPPRQPRPPPPPTPPPVGLPRGIDAIEVTGQQQQSDVPPSEPRNVTLDPGDEQIEVSWDDPESDGGSAVSGYDVRWRVDGESWPDTPQAEDVVGSPFDITRLANGETYEVQARARNEHGAGEWSDPPESAVPGTVPGAPRSVSLSENDQWILASWDDPESDGGADISGFDVQWREEGQSWPGTPQAEDVSNSLYVISGLDNGETYEVQVRAVNIHGEGDWSDPPVSATPGTEPGKPRSLSLSAGDQRIEVSWVEPESDGGAGITDYEVHYKKHSQNRWSAAESAGTDLAHSISGLDNGDTYDVQVRAVNRHGEGDWSDPPASTTPNVAPGQPQNVAASEGDQQITVTWAAPAGNSGTTVTGYDVQWKTDSGDWASPEGSKTFAATVLSHVIGSESGEELTNGTTYQVRVRARNGSADADAGDWSDPPVSAVPGTAPGVPRSVSLDDGDTLIEVSWEEPSSNGGATVTGYDVRWRKDGESWPSSPQAVGAADSPYEISGLDNGETYEVQVRAVNRHDPGDWSDPPASAVPGTVPGAPRSVSLSEGDGRIEVSWVEAASNGGADVTGYDVQWRIGGEAWPDTPPAQDVAASPYVISGLENDEEYEVQVRAVNRHGEGEWSVEEQAKPKPSGSAPGAPRNVEVGSGNTRLTVSWEEPSVDGGLSIIRYKVGELHRWLRHIGHDGRSVCNATYRWRFSVWHGDCVSTSALGSRRWPRRGSARRASRGVWAGTARRCSGSWPVAAARRGIGLVSHNRRRAPGRGGPGLPSWPGTVFWPRPSPSASPSGGRPMRSARTLACGGWGCARRPSTGPAMTTLAEAG